MRFSKTLPALAIAFAATQAQAELVLTFGGDFNLNATKERPRPDVGIKRGQPIKFKDALSGLSPLLDGDLNFANIETVVSDRQDLTAQNRAFVFVSHPNAISAAIDAGFNLFALANNHSADYGLKGIQETIAHTDRLAATRGVVFAGLASTQNEALMPKVFEANTSSGKYRIAFASVTGVTPADYRATNSQAGAVFMRDTVAMDALFKNFRAIQADYKIISIHFGKEGVYKIDAGMPKYYRELLKRGDLDLILSHSSHRVQPAEKVDGRVIFYSLGNMQMLGASDITGHPDELDYGVLGKLYLNRDATGRLVAQASEVIPLTQMHWRAKPLPPEEAAKRVKIMSDQGKIQLGATALTFQAEPNGFGRSCWGANKGPRAAKLCK